LFFHISIYLNIINKGLAVPLVVDGEGGRRAFPCIFVLHKRGLLVMLVQRYKKYSSNANAEQKNSIFVI